MYKIYDNVSFIQNYCKKTQRTIISLFFLSIKGAKVKSPVTNNSNTVNPPKLSL